MSGIGLGIQEEGPRDRQLPARGPRAGRAAGQAQFGKGGQGARPGRFGREAQGLLRGGLQERGDQQGGDG